MRPFDSFSNLKTQQLQLSDVLPLTTKPSIINVSGMKTIAFFDFDGTLTTRDTLVDFTRYAFGNIKFAVGSLMLTPFLVLFGLKRVSRDDVARRFIQYFYKNKVLSDLEQKAREYVSNNLPAIMNQDVFKAFCQHKKNSADVVVVSASPSIWLSLWCKTNNAGLIATRLEAHNGILSGIITGKRCIGNEKVTRIKKKFILSDYSRIIAYGNSDGATAMLEMAHEAYYVNGRSVTKYRPKT